MTHFYMLQYKEMNENIRTKTEFICWLSDMVEEPETKKAAVHVGVVEVSQGMLLKTIYAQGNGFNIAVSHRHVEQSEMRNAFSRLVNAELQKNLTTQKSLPSN